MRCDFGKEESKASPALRQEPDSIVQFKDLALRAISFIHFPSEK